MDTSKKSFTLAFDLEKKLYDAVKSLLFVSQFLCVAPIGVHRFQPISWISWRVLLHLAWCATAFTYFSISVYVEFTREKSPINIVNQPLFLSENLVFLIHILYLMSSCYYNYSNFAKLIRRIVSIDCKFLDFDKHPNYNELRRFAFKHFSLLGAFILSVVLVYCFFDKSDFGHAINNLFVYTMPNVIIGISMLKYYQLLFGIYLRWKFLIEAVQEFRDQYKADISKIGHPPDVLDLLRGIYFSLDASTREVNSVFSYSILITYFGSFINLSLNIFFVYKCVDADDGTDMQFLLYSLIWVAMHMGKMFTILYYNHQINAEKDNIALILKELHPHNIQMETTAHKNLHGINRLVSAMDTLKKPFAVAFSLEPKLYDAIRPFLLTSQIFCSAPIGVHQLESFSWKSWKFCIHFFWYLVIYFSLVVSIYHEYAFFNISLPNIQKPLFFSEYVVFLVHVVVIMIAGYYKHMSFAKFIRTVVSIDCKLIKFGINPNYLELRRFALVHHVLLGIFAFATIVVNYFYSGMQVVGLCRSVTVYLIPNLIIGMSILQYYELLHGICLRWKSLLEALQDFQGKYKTDISLLKDPSKLISRLRVIFSSLETFTKEVNSIFAYSIIIIYLGSFLNISINIFLIYKFVDQDTKIDMGLMMYSLVWVAMHSGKMFFILYYNHSIILEKDNIALVLSDLQPHTEQMEILIRRFLLQLMVNSRAHVICNLINLNMAFIKSLLVNISTLVIFLIQYDVTFEALTNTHNNAPTL